MEDLNRLLKLTETYPMQLEQMAEEFLSELRLILWGKVDSAASNKDEFGVLQTESPFDMKNRKKRLSLLNEDKEFDEKLENPSFSYKTKKKTLQKSTRLDVEQLEKSDIENVNKATENEVLKATVLQTSAKNRFEKDGNGQILIKSGDMNLMPPPPAPLATAANEIINKRSLRAARIKCEQNLKEPKLGTKLRRPTTNEVKIKLEQEQRQSQMHKDALNTNTSNTLNKISNGDAAIDMQLSQKSNDLVFLIPGKQLSIVPINSDVEDMSKTILAYNKKTAKEQISEQRVDSTESGICEIHIKIKREKTNLENQEKILVAHSDQADIKASKGLPPPICLAKNETTAAENTLLTSSMSSTANSANGTTNKKSRKKKQIHKPTKVERFSVLDPKPSPISSRTRQCSISKTNNNETSSSQGTKRLALMYKDAVETPPSDSNKSDNAITNGVFTNETADLGPSADATFCTNPAQTTFQVAPGRTTFVVDSNPNATITLSKNSDTALADATFDINQESKTNKDKEDDVAGQRSLATAKDLSLPNNDDIMTEDEEEIPVVQMSNFSDSAKMASKMHTRTKALFSPLVQSPVKLRVEAFENAAVAEQSNRLLRNRKKIITVTSATTPIIAKLKAPPLGRFLTPTQTSNIIPINSAIAKKGTTSASKALPKSTSVSSLLRSNSSASTKTLPRENSSGDDFRKGLHKLAEERKRQREQNHLLAAQQREAKVRERVERIGKLAKGHEEKRLLKKQQEQEQKKRELEEIQRKLRQQQEEAAKLKAAKEGEILQMKQQDLAEQKMLPPPPKTVSKYTFEMLHEDDSTDDEDKVSYKRPPPPSWSRKHVRGPTMLKQEYIPSAYIDSLFSVQPMTADLKIIFPDIDARHLKRNSSVFWSTPPRYSELPKY